MADNFGLKHGIDGEREFKKALSEINQRFKVLGSEMKESPILTSFPLYIPSMRLRRRRRPPTGRRRFRSAGL